MSGVSAELAFSDQKKGGDPEIFASSSAKNDEWSEKSEGSEIMQHLAFVLDGNRRWARARNLPAMFGHRRGYENAKKLISSIEKYGVKYVTYYVFSQENWNRSSEEVGFLMSLFRELFYSSASFFHENNLRLMTIGNLKSLPEDIRQSILSLEHETESNDGITLVMAVSYSGRNEILRAAKKIAQDVVAKKIDADTLTEDDFSCYLDTKGIPDPDAIIRTSEKRISNFLLWQCAYSEIFFVDKFWPDFSEEDLKNVVNEFSRRKRRYGR